MEFVTSVMFIAVCCDDRLRGKHSVMSLCLMDKATSLKPMFGIAI